MTNSLVADTATDRPSTCPEWCVSDHIFEAWNELLHYTDVVSEVALECSDLARLEFKFNRYMRGQIEADVNIREGDYSQAFSVNAGSARALAVELLRIADEMDRMTG